MEKDFSEYMNEAEFVIEPDEEYIPVGNEYDDEDLNLSKSEKEDLIKFIDEIIADTPDQDAYDLSRFVKKTNECIVSQLNNTISKIEEKIQE